MTPWKEAIKQAVLAAQKATEEAQGVTPLYSYIDDGWQEAILGILKSLEQSGYVVVPREPTEVMFETYADAADESGDDFGESYTAMIQAWEKERESENNGSHIS